MVGAARAVVARVEVVTEAEAMEVGAHQAVPQVLAPFVDVARDGAGGRRLWLDGNVPL